MTKQEFLQVLECLVIHLEIENEKRQSKNDPATFEAEAGELPF